VGVVGRVRSERVGGRGVAVVSTEGDARDTSSVVVVGAVSAEGDACDTSGVVVVSVVLVGQA
jgi:hypothetical protein